MSPRSPLPRTDWYDADIKPVRNGWYEREYKRLFPLDFNNNLFQDEHAAVYKDYWYEGVWYYTAQYRRPATYSECTNQTRRWRGVKKT